MAHGPVEHVLFGNHEYEEVILNFVENVKKMMKEDGVLSKKIKDDFIIARLARAFFLKSIFDQNSELIKNLNLQKKYPHKESYMDWLLKRWEEYSREEEKMIIQLDAMREQFRKEDLEAALEILKHRIREIELHLGELEEKKTSLQSDIEAYEKEKIPLLASIYENNILFEEQLNKCRDECLELIFKEQSNKSGGMISEDIAGMLRRRAHMLAQDGGAILFSKSAKEPFNLEDLLKDIEGDQTEIDALKNTVKDKIEKGALLLGALEREIKPKNDLLMQKLESIKNEEFKLRQELEAITKEEEILKKEAEELGKLLSGIEKKLNPQAVATEARVDEHHPRAASPFKNGLKPGQ